MDDKKGKVLVVDDEKINCSVLATLLEDYKVIIAKDGKQALKRARKLPLPDLILLDIILPDMNGYEVCEKLKKDDQTKDIPIIFITVKSSAEEEAKGLKLGAVDYISKPFSPAIVQVRVANHMELKKQRDLLQHLNMTDSLTQIANRRRFDLQIQHEWAAALKAGQPLSMLMIDIDFFKQYNDYYGHCEGDRCLQEITGILALSLRDDSDLLARFGGEEFACILPATDQEQALVMAKEMMESIRQRAISHPGSPINDSVTISIGYHTAWPTEQQSALEFIESTDKALYDAKRKGRDCISPSNYE